MSAENKIATTRQTTRPDSTTPAAILVQDLHKSFRIPTQRVDSLKERAVHPFASRDYRDLRALDGVSFEIHQGEFFGIVGRNGSGKSTLLKLLSSIYRADSGTIKIAGRLAPFIELGVGFNHELTARENVVLNGVMMGLTPRDMRRRLDRVIEFAELSEFADLKLKNYSSGMLVRLAFSVMMEADADVLLIDEVLAVGDASFQQKCADAFHEMKAAGKTIVLVTHDMSAVESYCHRAMLLSDGEVQHIGKPDAVGREYLKLNFPPEVSAAGEGGAAKGESKGAELVACRLENEAGKEVSSLESAEPIRLHVEIGLLRNVSTLHVGLVVANADGLGLFELGTPVATDDGRAFKGKRVVVTAESDNPLAAGRHFIHCGIQSAQGISVFVSKATSFVVYGAEQPGGVIAPKHEIEAIVEGQDTP
jgi:ABC-2 type transport system ATP-binding protein